MISLKRLEEDRQAELTDKPFYDCIGYSGLTIIGTYYDTNDKVILKDSNGRITLNTIYTSKNEKDYFIHLGKRYYIENFARW